jgi:hypothetical protein
MLRAVTSDELTPMIDPRRDRKRPLTRRHRAATLSPRRGLWFFAVRSPARGLLVGAVRKAPCLPGLRPPVTHFPASVIARLTREDEVANAVAIAARRQGGALISAPANLARP